MVNGLFLGSPALVFLWINLWMSRLVFISLARHRSAATNERTQVAELEMEIFSGSLSL